MMKKTLIELNIATSLMLVFLALSCGYLVSALEVSTEIPDKYQEVLPGQDLQFQVQLENIEQAGRQDISLEYFIKKGDIIVNYRKELKAVETQASFLASIKVPEETMPGVYALEVDVNSKNSANSMFRVKSSEVGQIRNYLLILIAAIVVVGVLISWELHRLFKVERDLLKKRRNFRRN